MEKINFRKIGILLTFVLMLNSCEKWIDPEINISPNAPADVTLNLLLPSSQAGIAYVFGGDHSRYSGMWMQHLSGVDRQSFALERYSVLNSDANNLWNTLYGGVLKNLVIMVDKAQAQEAFTYEALAKIHIAFTLGIITDVWGDAPYSDALFAETTGNLTPTYDSQEQLYATINSYLDEAVNLLGQTSAAGVAVPGNDDLFFGGDKAKWMKVAKALKVRYALHLSERSGYDAVRNLLNAGGLMESNDDSWSFQFTNNSNEWNPRYQFDNDRGDIRVGKKIVDMMAETEDPRMDAYFRLHPDAENPDYVGSPPGGALVLASYAGPGYASQNSPVPFLTYYEQKFIEAEAFVGNDNARAAAAYSAGIKASLEAHGVFDQDWFDANSTLDTSLEDHDILAQIMDAKYIAMFLHSETWVDWRRTGLPELTPAIEAVSAIPRRYLYTTDEINYNPANVPTGLTSTSRVWWDVQ